MRVCDKNNQSIYILNTRNSKQTHEREFSKKLTERVFFLFILPIFILFIIIDNLLTKL